MSNPSAPNQITDAVASVIHSVSPHGRIQKSLSLPCQVRLQRRRPHDETYEAELVTLVTNQFAVYGLFMHETVVIQLQTCLYFHFIFSLCWIYAASAHSVLSGIRVCILDSAVPFRVMCVQIYSHPRAHSLATSSTSDCKNKNVRNSSKTLQICTEIGSCWISLFIIALKNVNGSTTETVSFLFSWSRWVANIGNTKIILAQNEKHNYMTAGGIDVINMVPRGQRKQHSSTQELLNKLSSDD